MSRRTRARTVALQVLFQDDLNPQHNPADTDDLIVRRLREPELIAFGRELVAGVRRNRREIDDLLAGCAAHWSVHRMSATDRNVLRLGAYELLYTSTPPRAVIDEAVELAKRFGTAQSGAFVNGILDRLMRERRGGRPAADDSASVNRDAGASTAAPANARGNTPNAADTAASSEADPSPDTDIDADN